MKLLRSAAELIFSGIIGRIYLNKREPDCYIISYRKSGRTWLRMMLAKVFALHFGYTREAIYDSTEVLRAGYIRAPYVDFNHGQFIYPGGVKEVFSTHKKQKFVLLARDPRDTVVSSYISHTRRRSKKRGSISSFIKDPQTGVDSIISFMNSWYSPKESAYGFCLIRYEDLHKDAEGEIRRLLAFIGLPDVSDSVIKDSVRYARFDNMRKLSTGELSHEKQLAPRNPDDPESYKVRKGKVGGYTEYLEPDDIEYINQRISDSLDPSFMYNDP